MCRQQACRPLGMAGIPCSGEYGGGEVCGTKGTVVHIFNAVGGFYSRILSHIIPLTKLSENRIPKKRF